MSNLIKWCLLFINFNAFGQNGSFVESSYLCQDQVSRPFIVYKPQGVEKEQKRPLLIFLHGSISNPNLKKNPLKYAKNSQMLELADKGGFYILFPYGQKGATWFDEIGMDMIFGEMATTVYNFPIDNTKIFMSGFSDGGSGALYFSMTKPFSFAGFISLNGSFSVAKKLGVRPIFPQNMNQIPLYIINTKNDLLYDIEQVTTMVSYLKNYNKNIIYKQHEGNHELSYFPHEIMNLIQWIDSNIIQEYKRISWETNINNDSVKWIKKIEIDTSFQKKPWHQCYKLQIYNDKADFGVNYDYTWNGAGLKVASFKSEQSTAQIMGLEVDDIILKMQDDTIRTAYSPYYYLAEKKAGQETSLTIQRNGIELLLKGKFNDGNFYTVLKTDAKSGKIESYFQNEILYVNTSNVSALEINLEDIIDNPILKIELNGKMIPLSSQKSVLLNVDE